MSSDSENYSDYEESDLSLSLPVTFEMPPQKPIGQNKVRELIDDNKNLRSKMRQTALEMEAKRQELEEFYSSLKSSAKLLLERLKKRQEMVTAQKNEITFLKAEKLRLQIVLNENGAANMNLNDPSNTNGNVDAGFKNDYEETLESLVQQLQQAQQAARVSAAEREREINNFRTAWEEREKQIHDRMDELKEYYTSITTAQQQEIESFQYKTRQYEETVSVLREQVKSVIAEHQVDVKTIETLQSNSSALLKNFQEKERQNLQLQKDAENLKIKKKAMEDELIRHKQELGDVRHQLVEKEKSLDQLFEVYNEERQKAPSTQSNNQTQMTLDSLYAQYICAEESIKKKNEEIAKLGKKNETDKKEASTQISIYKQQADIFKKDFEMEREARQKQHSECENLKTMVGQYQMEMQRMKSDLMRYQAQQFQVPRQPPNY